MVQFNDDRSFTIKCNGDAEDYLNYLHALTRLIATQDTDLRDKNSIYFGSRLLEDMLPDASQNLIIS